MDTRNGTHAVDHVRSSAASDLVGIAVPAGISRPADLPRWKEVEVDAALVRPAPGNRVVTPESVSDLLPSMESQGQLVPGIIFPDPELPGYYRGADCNRRAMVCRILGRKLRAYLLDQAPTEEQVIRIRAATNFHRKNASAYEIAADIKRWLELNEGATQRQASEAFGISAGHVCKLLDKLKSACGELRQAEEGMKICPDSARIIATLPSPEQQREALRDAIAHDLKREAVERLVARMKGITKKARTKPVKVKLDGVQMVASNPTLEGLQAFGERLLAAVRRCVKDGDGVEILPSRLKGV